MKKEETYITTYTGKKFYPFAPRAEHVDILDIVVPLSRKGRWNDHCKFSYSVGAHSLQVAQRIRDAGGTEEEQLAGLLHDASEAYFADVPTPIKRFLKEISVLEDGIQGAIEARYKLPFGIFNSDIVKEADKACLIFEAKTLLHRIPDWVTEYSMDFRDGILKLSNANHAMYSYSSPFSVEKIDNDKIMKAFLDKFFQLGGGTR
jgi:hypothetical protein